MGIETERELAFHSPLGEDKLMVRHLIGREQLGAPFDYVAVLFSEDHDIQAEDILGKSCTVEVKFDPSNPRFFNGIACEFTHAGSEETYALYRVVLRPWLWLLSRNRDCRIFQNKTTQEIARQIFSERKFSDFEDHLFFGLTPREYCVQYGESDLDFISRLLEDEGIYYYFKHEKNKHTLVLSDSISAHDRVPGFEAVALGYRIDPLKSGLGEFAEWRTTKQILPGGVTLNDYSFEKSRADIRAPREKPHDHSHAASQLYIYPGGYSNPAPGREKAIVRLEEAQANYEVVYGETDSRGLYAGALFELEGARRKDQNHEYLIIDAQYEIDSGQYRSGGASALRMTTRIHAIDSKVQYRPPRVTAIPRVAGPQSARVVGPKGQEIWTDNFGRVKVQFAWDHEGKFDENSSCFLRVSQTWQGADWGAWHVPRIGQEVLVGFLDGDLDRPIVIGRVNNDYNLAPWDLPDQATRSGWKTHSIGGGKGDYNELRFEDAKKKEEIFIRAQRNMTTRVRNNRHSFVGNNDSTTVKKNVSLVLQDGDYETTALKGLMRHQAPENLFEVSAKEIVCSADEGITLKVQNTSIKIDAMGITLSAGPMTEIKLMFQQLNVISPMVDINPMAGMPSGPAQVDRPRAEENTEKFDGQGGGGARGARGGGGGAGG